LLTSKQYAKSWLELIRSGYRIDSAGQPADTCSITVVDADGSIAACQHSCASAPWVNSLFAEGVWLAGAGDHFLERMPPPRQRPIGNDGSVVVFREDKLAVAGGSPSNSLNAAVLQNLVNLIDFDMTLEESVHLPRFGNGRLKIPVEVGFGRSLIGAVRRRGLEVEVVNTWDPHLGSFAGVVSEGSSLVACGDPRRDAVAGGY
jgi:gamma-glutamyltranspeptidase/glutathione hydrolase